MSFVIGFGTAPFYAQIPHDRHEEKCRVKVTLNSNSEDIPSVIVTTGNHPTGVPDVRVLFLVPGGKVHQKLIQFRV